MSWSLQQQGLLDVSGLSLVLEDLQVTLLVDMYVLSVETMHIPFLGVSKDNPARNTFAYFSTAVLCQTFGILCRGVPFPPRQVLLGVVKRFLGGLARLEENQCI